MQVLIAIWKNILKNIIIENQTNIVSHPYCIVIAIKELYTVSRKCVKRTRIVNLYNNKVREKCIWQGLSSISDKKS